ncbi:peptidase M23 [Pseudidiomarina aquimaris]|uniref:Peptidase M23 n=2 Tax=Pseudidiomarina aquimaris TaxID=641841 RepID=A0A432XNQ9_9GAMM|nr:peptidase M23 [Pseudidiomarina aquimaris]|tara:strand:+ start:475 stop:1623 length:1149 start_codon:yes stop_codon:yes gene_type:complete
MMTVAMRALLISLLLLVTTESSAWQNASQETAAETQARIDAIARELERRSAAMQQRARELSATEKQVQQLDQRIAAVASQLAELATSLQRTNQRIDQLQQQQRQLIAEQKQQQQWLAKQVDMAYRIGEHDLLKLILNQEEPAEIERLHGYYGYFNRARLQKLDELKATQAELEEVTAQVASEQQQLAQQKQQQEQQQQRLEQEKSEQQKLVRQLAQEQRQDQSRVAQLEQDQRELENVLAAIIAALRDEPQLDGLRQLKGKMSWPTQGNVQRIFGRSRSGGVKWKGILIDAAEGTPVKAIADGRVIYANWMRGFGLLLVLDHGDGYMSLYGHNQTLLPNVGEVVRRGEEIARVGQSGGRESPALYFEIRLKGDPVNPTQWVR